VQTVVIPRHQPRDEDDWSTPEELGLVRPSAPSLLHLAKGNPRDSTPTKATAQRPMSPWRLQEQIINTAAARPTAPTNAATTAARCACCGRPRRGA